MILDELLIDIKQKSLVEETLNSNNIYIYGTNNISKKLSQMIKIKGFINDFTNEKSYLNLPILNSQDLDKKIYIISCSLSMYPLSAIRNLNKSGFYNIVTVLDVLKYSTLKFEDTFITDAKIDLEINFSNYEKIYNRINEVESQNIFRNILNFRKNFDLKYMRNYKVDNKRQYFEEFLNLKDGEVFIDAGGFDGQTSIEFIKHSPNYKSIYIFEPDNENLEIAKKNLHNYKNVNFISKGLSNHKDTLKFDMGSGSASKISEIGAITIEVDTLDNLVKEKITFIKMDIEGAEGLAIEGMKNHILNDYPKMAISVYHKADDFWKITEQILNIRNDYDIYMRHYTEGTDETIMFFIPKK
ncbi:FkbM family methyltransferase [Arcobacter aquimarinus]|uniref:Methyltransferase, FkbM family n=1 Tax=Arcobacter aquimarinus TaxID=1315211 RepID=A0AAE7B6R1_9BACT|nr:FkbM family methyltransferase [Arcobacter aquimarinus]QKE27075.1 methyltransferase, FkbM family [Arcobacter aquimarinus]RXI30270.1 methyltransferase [Arcobacter aquimarinus]